MPESSITTDMVWAAIDQARIDCGIDPSSYIPEGAFTVEDYALRYGVPEATARGQLDRLVASGQLKMAKHRHRARSGRYQPMNFYWTPEPPPKVKRKG